MAGVFTFYSFDLLTFNLLAELPYSNVTFSQRMNTPGSFAGELLLSDPRVQKLDPIGATNRAKTLIIVDLDGQIVWGGINWTRTYDSDTRALKVGGLEGWSYFARRFQAKDYTVPPSGPYWSTNPADSCAIAAQLVYDAIAKPSSAFANLIINVVHVTPNPNPVTASYAASQSQMVDSMVSSLAGGGYGTGFDFAIDWAWSNGQGSYPIPTLNLTYPRRGRAYSSTSPTLMTGGSGAIKYVWPEDGTKQANSIVGTASGPGNLVYTPGPDQMVLGAGYPLLEAQTSFSNITTQSQLVAAVQGGWAQNEWGAITPQFIMPVIGDPSLGTFVIGDDERIVITPDERFPAGVDTAMRLVGLDVKLETMGVSTMIHTFNPPLALAPTPAPPN